jgi:TonB family protein
VFAIVAFSLAAHAGAVASADFVIGGTKGDDPLGEKKLAAVEFEFSCWSDAGLGMSARMLSCSLPGFQDADCERKALEALRYDMILCDGLQEDSDAMQEAVAFMSAAELDAIEPMPMLDVPELDEFEAAKLLEEEIEEKVAEAEERISNPKQSGQVIEVLDPGLEVTPDNARFLSEFDTKVEKETVARGSTEEMVSAPAPKELPIDADPDELPEDPTPSGPEEEIASLDPQVQEGNQDEGLGEKSSESPLLAMRAQEFREQSTIGEESGSDALAANGLAATKGNGSIDQSARQAREGQEEVSGGGGAKKVLPSLRPSEEMLSRLVGGGSVDKLDGVESGKVTALNSKKWKFASFFNRMKRQVAQNWHPDTVYVRRDPTGKVYGTKNRVTVLEVSLKPNGSLAKVVVAQQSGVGFLDDEAISAFHKAQPFPNPPSGLVDSGSQLITFSFGFHFQVGTRRDTWKLFKYN